jgi:2-oxoglutarate ferredoxin oxidoreductase subunit alpha
MNHEVSFSIVGSGGDGAVAAGEIAALACATDGLHVIKTEAYGPQIRGGESSSSVRVSATPIFAQAGAVDALVVFSWSDFARFANEITLAPDAVVFYEADDAPAENAAGNLISIAFNKLAPKAKNMIALGVVAPLLGLPLDGIRAAIRQRFAKKSQAVIDANLSAFDQGVILSRPFDSLRSLRAGSDGEGSQVAKLEILHSAQNDAKLLMSGNEAAAVGAIHAGCSFFAGYPITPSSEVLHFLGEWLPKIGGTSLQTEDELSAIGAVIGASFAGAKAMTATSGPGLSLMSEMLGLSSIAEIPSVIFNVQRGGPSTGLPTKSEQSDLLHALHASHGDTPRVVLACCDVEDAFHTTVDAFNIAEEFQVPVIVLSDQLIAQRRETIESASLVHDVVQRRLAEPSDDGAYRRYLDTIDGVSPMSIPGIADGMYQTNGLEHDEVGRPSSMFVVHEKMNAKRYRKMDAIAGRYRLYRKFGSDHPDLGILCWGSSAGPVREAVEALNVSDLRVCAFVPRILSPLPTRELQAFVNDCEELLVIELSYSAQFHQYLRSQIDLPRAKTHVLARSGGKSLATAEVIAAVRQLLGAGELQEVLA